MKPLHILVAEDDVHIREGLIAALESEHYHVTAVSDGTEALQVFSDSEFCLLILDIMMPGVNGFDVCRQVRQKNKLVPILFLSAKGEEIDKVLGLELGADDYITKPFGVRELLARVAAALRRSGQDALKPQDTDALFYIGTSCINPKTYTVTNPEGRSDLSAKEMALLKFFSEKAGEVITRDDLLNRIWGLTYYGGTRTLDQHMAKLRKKIEPDPASPQFLLTIHGVGYRYEPGNSTHSK